MVYRLHQFADGWEECSPVFADNMGMIIEGLGVRVLFPIGSYSLQTAIWGQVAQGMEFEPRSIDFGWAEFSAFGRWMKKSVKVWVIVSIGLFIV
jgi:hypothetical protein